MANQDNKSPEQQAAEKAAALKLEQQQAEMARLSKKSEPSEPKDATPNLTRDSIEQALVGTFMAQGKERAEAESLAKKRAFEIIP